MFFANSEDADEMLHNVAYFISVYTVCNYDKNNFQQKKLILYLEIIKCDTVVYTMDHPKFITSNQNNIKIYLGNFGLLALIIFQHSSLK